MMPNITVMEAAQQLGKSPQFVRIGLQRGFLPIGTAIKTSSQFTYHISQERLDAYLSGKDLIDFFVNPEKQNAAQRQLDGNRLTG